MATKKNTYVNIALLTIIIATISFGNCVAAQESGRLFLLPGESSDVRVMESDGAVTSSGTIDKFHIANYSKSDKRMTDPAERQWPNGPDQQPVDHQSSNNENGAVLHWWQSPDAIDDGRIDSPVKLSFDNTNTDTDMFILGGHTGWHLPNMKYLYASTDPGISLPNVYGGTASNSATDLVWSQIDSGSVFDWEDTLYWKEEKNAYNEAGFSKWLLPNTSKLSLNLNYSLFPGITGFATNKAMFNSTSVSNAAGQNHYTVSDFEFGLPSINSTDFSLLSAQETEQSHYWPSKYYNDGLAYDDRDSAYDANIFTIDTQGRITGITQKIKKLLP